MSRRRIRAIAVKELRTCRRTTSLVVAMAVIPLIFLIQPLVSVFAVASSGAAAIRRHDALIYLLAIPALVPATVAAYAVVGERQQGTLEPLLTTPIRREELLLAKALAVLAPSVIVAYVVFGVFVVLVELFAHPGVASAFLRGPVVLAQVIFTPLVAGWTIWISIAVSTRAGDIRVAQQLSALASLPTIAISTLVSIGVIHPSVGLAVMFGAALVAGNRVGWRVVSRLFDRERLIAGTR